MFDFELILNDLRKSDERPHYRRVCIVSRIMMADGMFYSLREKVIFFHMSLP